MIDELKRQVAIVTGAGRGFGRAIAVRLAAAGAAVTVTVESTQVKKTGRPGIVPGSHLIPQVAIGCAA